MSDFITCRFDGRLGNWLFQIANVYALSLKYGLNPIFNESSLNGYRDNIFHKINFVSSDNFENINLNRVAEKSLEYNEIILSTDKSYILDGYFQSPKYINKYRNQILELFTLPDPIMRKINEIYENIVNKFDPNCKFTSLHVRRGDYLIHKEIFLNLNNDYYTKAIQYFDKNCVYLIFSDDITWCKENFDYIDKKVFIENLSNYEDLFLMSKCDNHIIANSSFSWWGAWLNNKDDKIIVAPKPWINTIYSPTHDISDIYDENWRIVQWVPDKI